MDSKQVYVNDLAETVDLTVLSGSAEIVTWNGSKCLRLVDALVVLPVPPLPSATVVVEIGADQAAYPGIAFRVLDSLNFELAYTQPHTSGLWDAVQYDPVFHGSNTWQIHHGPPFQKEALVPLGRWYTLKVSFYDQTVVVRVNDESPLIVPCLAHPHRDGLIGLWTFRPAYFRNARVGRVCDRGVQPEECGSTTTPQPRESKGSFVRITEWLLHGYGVVQCETSGLLLVNRYLPLGLTQATLTRKFEVAELTRVELKYGFSDTLSLAIDGYVIFSGSNTFRGLQHRDSRGYVDPEHYSIVWDVGPGVHTIKAVLGHTEPFGWGMSLSIRGDGLRLLPPWIS